jgi:hypothetical protein
MASKKKKSAHAKSAKKAKKKSPSSPSKAYPVSPFATAFASLLKTRKWPGKAVPKTTLEDVSRVVAILGGVYNGVTPAAAPSGGLLEAVINLISTQHWPSDAAGGTQKFNVCMWDIERAVGAMLFAIVKDGSGGSENYPPNG